MEECQGRKKNIKYYVFVAIMYILIFQDFLQRIIGVFKYFDEILALMVIPLFINNLIKNKDNLKIKKYDLVIVTSLIGLGIIGIVSNIKYKYQPYNIVFSDFLVMYKFFLAYYFAEFFTKDTVIDKSIIIHVKVIIVFLFILTVFNYIFNVWGAEIRYGIRSNKVFYSHQTAFAAVLIYLLAMMIRFKQQIFNKYVMLILIMLLTTLRVKAIGFVILFLLIALYINKTYKKVSIKKIIIMALILLLCSYQQIKYYFVTVDDSARSMLLKTSFEIASEHFPLGAGFGTYASYYSAVKYSPLYTMYGLENIYGLQRDNASFISDSFWPMIIGQFGYLGTILYIIIIFIIFMKIQKKYTKETKYIYMSKLICLLYLLISSTAESAFVNSFAIPLAIMIGI